MSLQKKFILKNVKEECTTKGSTNNISSSAKAATHLINNVTMVTKRQDFASSFPPLCDRLR